LTGLIAYFPINVFISTTSIISIVVSNFSSNVFTSSFATIVLLPFISTRTYSILSPKANPWFAGNVQGVVVHISTLVSESSILKLT
jgi:hypothetical protein